MAGSFCRELEDLLNPLPKFADPEDDDDEATKAKVIEEFNEEDDDDNGVGLSVLRKNNRSLLSDTDGRYVGKAVSRKQLLMDIEGSDEEEDEDQYSIEEDNDEEEDSIENEQSDDYGDENNLDDTDEEEGFVGSNLQLLAIPSSKTRGTDITFPQGVDFHKLTEGMDDLGTSEGEEDGGGDDDDDDDSEENEDMDEDESSDDEDNDGDEKTLHTFSQAEVDEEVEKGKAVKNQLALWDQLLEGRIKIQKALVTANQLPQPLTFPEFKRNGGVEFVGALKNSHKALKALQRSVLELHDHLLCQNTDTRPIALGSLRAQSQDEEIKSEEELSMQESRLPKRKLEMAEYPNFMAKRFAAFQPYCNTTLQKWHDKTRLSMGKSTKGFGAFDRNILTQVEQVLMDKERLLRRTQTRRSEYRVLGKKESSDLTSDPVTPEEGEVAEQQMKANAHLKDLDEDIFDDDDFYHQLLRELIERKTSAVDPNNQVAMGRQWLAIQKLRRKIKKKVDTKASKGRKIRYHIHSKLVNFMAPMDHSSMSDEARNELYRGLFGQNSALRE